MVITFYTTIGTIGTHIILHLQTKTTFWINMNYEYLEKLYNQVYVYK